jgi:type I restriction enzyme, S subunit
MSEWKEYKLCEIGTIARGKSKHRPRDASFLYQAVKTLPSLK